MKYIAYALRACRNKNKVEALKQVTIVLVCIATIIMAGWMLVSTIATPYGAGEAEWNFWYIMGRAAGGIG